jgi:serine/threonine-protein kinase
MIPIGTVIDNKYEILKQIGQGGMSTVYLAMDNRLNKQWAIKEIKKTSDKNSHIVIQSFLVEAHLLKTLDHPTLPRIVDIIDNGAGVIYVVMDYIAGESLNKVVQRYGAQPQEYVIEWAKQLCNVLAYLHSRPKPIIYRDMKPGNVMLTPEGNVKLIDFGIAREYKSENLEDTTSLGTRGYAAPEQFGGKGQTDARTDIYGLGVTIYYLITNQNPCEPPYEIYPIRQINPNLSAGLERIIQKCTRLDPNERYQSCEELMYDLEHYEEIDDDYKQKQTNKIAIFSLSAIACILFLIIGLLGLKGINNERLSNYNIVLNEATNYVSKSIATNTFSEDAVTTYETAISVDPRRNEAYLKMLDYYIRMGQTQNGLDKIGSYIDRNNGDLQSNNEVLMSVARLYFNGTTSDLDFNVNYVNAAKYFSMVDSEEIPESAYYKELSLSLSQFGSTVEWGGVIQGLENFEEFNDNQNKDITQINNYLSLAGVYIANKSYILNEGKDPYQIAIDTLNKAEDTMEFLNENEVNDTYKKDIILRRGEAYHIKAANIAEVSEAKVNFEKAIGEYNNVISESDNNEVKKILMNKVADIYRTMKEYDKAGTEYSKIIQSYPNDTKAFTSYGMMLLVDDQNPQKALELYLKAKNTEGSNKDTNLYKLEQKLKNAGII